MDEAYLILLERTAENQHPGVVDRWES